MGAAPRPMAAERADGAAIRPYCPADRARVLQMIGRVWDEERRRRHDLLWDWKHARDSGPWDPGHLARVVERGGEVVGYAGAIPARFLIDGRVVEGAFCLDTLVDPGARGAGIRLLRDQFARGGLLLGAGNPRSRALYEKISGRTRLVVRVARKMALVLDAATVLRHRGLPAPLAAAAGLAHRGARAIRGRRDGGEPAPGFVLEEVDRFPEGIDALGLEFARGFRRSVLRDREYLDWRFADGPVGYRIRLLRDPGGRLRGYLVHRPARINGRPAVILVEIVATGDRAPAYAAMLARVEREALACGAGEIQTLDPGCPILAGALARRGYFRRREPHHILGYQAGPAGEAADFTDGGSWYIGLGDADLEFIFFNQGVPDRSAAGLPDGARVTS